MLSLPNFSLEMNKAIVALNQATAHARRGGYPSVDFTSLVERLKDVHNAVSHGEPRGVKKTMSAIDAPADCITSSVSAGQTIKNDDLVEKRARAGRIGGLSKSLAKQIAARANGSMSEGPKKKKQQ